MKINKRKRNKRKESCAGVGVLLILAGLFWLRVSRKKYAVVDKKAYRARQIGI